jgi:hypothetical protein
MMVQVNAVFSVRTFLGGRDEYVGDVLFDPHFNQAPCLSDVQLTGGNAVYVWSF